ncbi:hypothetical protein Tco_0523242 [Tanacetum coccineum]
MLPSSGFLMLSKPVKKTTRVSLVPGFIPGPSSGMRGMRDAELLFTFVRQRTHVTDKISQIPGWLRGLGSCYGPMVIEVLPVNRLYWSFPSFSPFESLVMSLEESDDLVILDAEHVGPTLEAVLSMAEFQRLPNFHGCKVAARELLPPSMARVTHHADPVTRIEDILPKTGDMTTTEIPCRKVLEDKEKKRRKAEEKAAANAPAANIQAEAAAGKDAGLHLDTVERPVHDNVVPTVEASYSAGCFGNLPFTPQWGLTDSRSMDNSRNCQDMMVNLFTLADDKFFNEGVRDESAIKRSWKLLCQSSQQQANMLLCFEALKEQHADLLYTHESCKDVKARYKECKKELVVARIIPLRLAREKCLCVGKGFIDGISIGREEADIQAILKATPNVDPSSSETFMDAYEKLFDKRYPYVDKVARMYLLDPTGLQNVMPNETGPTPGGGPRDTPTTSYA